MTHAAGTPQVGSDNGSREYQHDCCLVPHGAAPGRHWLIYNLQLHSAGSQLLLQLMHALSLTVVLSGF